MMKLSMTAMTLTLACCAAASAQFAEKDAAVVHTLTSSQPGDGFGARARAVPDVDGDRKHDIVVSAPLHRVDGEVRGAVFVYSGVSGKLLWKATGAAKSGFGAAVAGSKDLDGDRRGEILVGAPTEGGSGRVHIYSGATGKVVHTLAGEAEGDRFGAAVFGPGDFDRDKKNDVVVGAPGHDAGGGNGGRVYLYSWKDPSKPKKTTDGDEKQGLGLAVCAMPRSHRPLFAAAGSVHGIYFRGLKLKPQKPTELVEGELAAITIVGDIDKDSYPEVFMAAAGPPGKSKAVLVSSDKGEVIRTFDAADGIGVGTGRAGDVDRDAWEDIVVGSPDANDGAGRITVYSGKTSKSLYTVTGTVAGGRLGHDCDGVRDLSGDRHADLIISRPGGEGATGAVFVISGKPPVEEKPESSEDG